MTYRIFASFSATFTSPVEIRVKFQFFNAKKIHGNEIRLENKNTMTVRLKLVCWSRWMKFHRLKWQRFYAFLRQYWPIVWHFSQCVCGWRFILSVTSKPSGFSNGRYNEINDKNHCMVLNLVWRKTKRSRNHLDQSNQFELYLFVWIDVDLTFDARLTHIRP